MNKLIEYWKDRLYGFEILTLPTDFSKSGGVINGRSALGVKIESKIVNDLRALSDSYDTSFENILIGSISVLLSKYTGQNDIVIGLHISNSEININRNILNDSQSFKDLVHKIHSDRILDQYYKDVILEDLVSEMGVVCEPSYHSMFPILFSIGDSKNYFQECDLCQFIQVINVIDFGEGELMIEINFADSLFKQETIFRFLDLYKVLLKTLSEQSESAYSNLHLMTNDEIDLVLYDWNSTEHYFPKDRTLHALFQEQVERTPDSIAIVYENDSLTYRELNERSNQLARHLTNEYRNRVGRPLTSDELIGIYVDRGVEMVVGILAVLKAGGAYLPLDINYPQSRIRFFVEDSKTQLVFSHRGLCLDLPVNVVYIDFDEELYQLGDVTNLSVSSGVRDLAYVIYTSGTTGKPKGVMVEHLSVVNLVYNYRHFFQEDDKLKILQFATISFDASVWEFFSALTFGGQLFISPNEVRQDVKLLADFIDNNQINIALIPPALLGSMPYRKLDNLKVLLVGGELCAENVIEKWSEGRQLMNCYGPTESTVIATMHLFNSTRLDNLNIGSPLLNVKAYVLDRNARPTPLGVVGELYIGGAGVARGYLGNESLTNERFVSNAFPSRSDLENGYSTLYRTGDLVCRLPNGDLKYIGRNDSQIKLRGHRIELGEVENCLVQIPGIAQACVIAIGSHLNSAQRKLVGYYVIEKSHAPQKEEDVLSTWERVYDCEYEKPIDVLTISSDFSAWNSYVTGRPIPLTEMFAWRDSILRLIRKLKPQKVLEIGVGSGIIMYPLLGIVERYVGVDLSRSVIERHRKNLDGKGFDVEFHNLRANQICELPKEDLYDTIIMNSVCQHFPSIMYLESILDTALDLLSDGGSIFLGDVFNYDIYEYLVEERFTYRGKIFSKDDIKRALQMEYDLLISPNYFNYLKYRLKRVNVEILPRDKKDYDNELSKYRYDVILTISDKQIMSDRDRFGNRSDTDFNLPFLSQISSDEILSRLSEVLPSYMIPDAVIPIERLPVNVNGKIDRNLLPQPQFEVSDGYVSPKSFDQSSVSNIWRNILDLERVGIDDDFFKLGGNSILATMASHLMSDVLKVEVKVSHIFEFKTISNILRNITATKFDETVIEKEF